jgi:hypothetical protein
MPLSYYKYRDIHPDKWLTSSGFIVWGFIFFNLFLVYVILYYLNINNLNIFSY